jgi:hypothetical protein
MRARGLAGVAMPCGTGERTFLRIQAESPGDFQKSPSTLRDHHAHRRDERPLGNLACRTGTLFCWKAKRARPRCRIRLDNVEALSHQSVELAISVPDGHMLRRLPLIYTSIRKKAHQVHKRTIRNTSPQGCIPRLSLPGPADSLYMAALASIAPDSTATDGMGESTCHRTQVRALLR